LQCLDDITEVMIVPWRGRKPALVLALLISMLACPVHADEGDAGAAGAYLRMGLGARPMGMGGGYVAVSNDAYASYWNPAGLVQVGNHQIGSMYAVMTLERDLYYISYAHGNGLDIGVGAGWIRFGVDEIEERDAQGQLIGSFDDAENAYYFSFAKGFASLASVGVSAKYLTHSLYDVTATGFGFDIGLLARPAEIFSLGLVFQDIGTKVEWDTPSDHSDEYPLNIRGGAAIRLLEGDLLMAADLEKNEEQSMRLHAGAEYTLARLLALRVGINDGKLTAGVGASANQLRVDYAYVADKLEEGDSSLISLTLRF
jgi:hypothetical protein